MINYFIVEDSMYYTGHKMIGYDDNKFEFGGTAGSRNVFMARLMNMSWAQFLRLCRDYYGATLVGKNKLYVVPYFANETDACRLCKELNKRMALVMANKT